MNETPILGKTFRHLNRYREVITILLAHGFGDLLQWLHLDEPIEAGLKGLMENPPVLAGSRPERVRLAVQELGPTYIKVGQYLSTRADLLPEEYLHELAKLQDRAPHIPAEEARRLIEEELGQPIERLFRRFDGHPLAAASIAQTHAAVLADGSEVVVKLQRPDIHAIVAADLEILAYIAEVMERRSEDWRLRRPSAIVAEISRSLEREMDFTLEASHIDHFQRQFAHDPTARAPKVYRELSTARVLTLERLHGTKADDVAALKRARIDPHAIARSLARHSLAMIFKYGFFHADPHPGNLLIQSDKAVGYLDFGMTGRLDRATREALADVFVAVSERDEASLSRALLALAERDEEPDAKAFQDDVAELMDEYAYRPLREWRLGRMLEQFFQIIARHRVRIPSDMFLIVKSLTQLESLARALDPGFDAVSMSKPYVRRVQEERLEPGRIVEQLTWAGRQTLDLLTSAPGELKELLRQMRLGRLQIEFEHKGLEPAMKELGQASNRLAYALFLGSLVVGSSLLVHAGLPPYWRGIPVLGVGGFVVSAVMGLWLLLAIQRHGRL